MYLIAPYQQETSTTGQHPEGINEFISRSEPEKIALIKESVEALSSEINLTSEESEAIVEMTFIFAKYLESFFEVDDTDIKMAINWDLNNYVLLCFHELLSNPQLSLTDNCFMYSMKIYEYTIRNTELLKKLINFNCENLAIFKEDLRPGIKGKIKSLAESIEIFGADRIVIPNWDTDDNPYLRPDFFIILDEKGLVFMVRIKSTTKTVFPCAGNLATIKHLNSQYGYFINKIFPNYVEVFLRLKENTDSANDYYWHRRTSLFSENGIHPEFVPLIILANSRDQRNQNLRDQLFGYKDRYLIDKRMW